MLAWILASKLKYRSIFIYGIVYVFTLLIFFTAKYIDPKLDFPEAVAIKQQEFLALGGNSAVRVNELEPNFKSFVTNAPQAFIISAVRPFPADVQHLLSLAAAVEINALILFFFAFLFFRKNRSLRLSPFLLFCLFFSFSVLMMIGYSVNVLGAIVRYRSIVFPFLVVPMAANTDWRRIAALISGGMTSKQNM